ncbi:MAG: GNAT family N-acetyltransferase [Acidobacteria bacterium]|nr:GNAT family N-acetyltransferase [Acidobacteriota bacterium]
MISNGVVLREIRHHDAQVLLRGLQGSPLPLGTTPLTSLATLEHFIAWAHQERAAGRAVCYVLLPKVGSDPVGVLLARRVERGFVIAEWGMRLAAGCVADRVVVPAVTAVLDLLFREFSTRRLETRIDASAASEIGLLERLGGQRECRLHGSTLDLWALNRERWMEAHPVSAGFWAPDPSPSAVPVAYAPVWTTASAVAAWRQPLPDLHGSRACVRELVLEDAPSLYEHLSSPAVTRHLPPPPNGVLGFERFVRWAQDRRSTGTTVCVGIAPDRARAAVGFEQLHPLDHLGERAEWGFALGEAFWGGGVFAEAAALLLDYAFDTLGVRRLEARVGADNARAAGALRKMGAQCDGRLGRVESGGGPAGHDELWSLRPEDWRAARPRIFGGGPRN